MWPEQIKGADEMIIGLGTDIVKTERIDNVLKKTPEQFIDRICSGSEKKYLQEGNDVATRLAKIWAVKEAASKALGTGIAQGVQFKDIELVHDKFGKPELKFFGRAQEILATKTEGGKPNIVVSISDDKPFAQAVVIIEKISC